jgi:hypothetical protein
LFRLFRWEVKIEGILRRVDPQDAADAIQEFDTLYKGRHTDHRFG